MQPINIQSFNTQLKNAASVCTNDGWRLYGLHRTADGDSTNWECHCIYATFWEKPPKPDWWLTQSLHNPEFRHQAEQPAGESEPLERQTGILSILSVIHSVSHQQVLQPPHKVPSKQIFSTKCMRHYSHHLRTGSVSTREITFSTVF